MSDTAGLNTFLPIVRATKEREVGWVVGVKERERKRESTWVKEILYLYHPYENHSPPQNQSSVPYYILLLLLIIHASTLLFHDNVSRIGGIAAAAEPATRHCKKRVVSIFCVQVCMYARTPTHFMPFTSSLRCLPPDCIT